MNKKYLVKIGVILGSFFVGIFILFLLIPCILNIFIDKYMPQIVGEINKATGLSAGIEDIRIVTTPKLTAGLKIKHFEIYTPQKEHVISAENFQVKISVLPIIMKSIKLDAVQVDKAKITLQFNKDGSLYIEKYFPKQDSSSQKQEQNTEEAFKLPFGMKLSNHLPDIHVGSYEINFVDNKDFYILQGEKTDVTDFIINKSIKMIGKNWCLNRSR